MEAVGNSCEVGGGRAETRARLEVRRETPQLRSSGGEQRQAPGRHFLS